MTQQELCERAAKVLGWEQIGSSYLTDLNILLPKVDKWCKERGYWLQVMSKTDMNEYKVVVFGDTEAEYFSAHDPDRATAILKALVAAGEKI